MLPLRWGSSPPGRLIVDSQSDGILGRRICLLFDVAQYQQVQQ
jgi:hypothetical protein